MMIFNMLMAAGFCGLAKEALHNCMLNMFDSYGDGWDNAKWWASGFGQGPFFIEEGASATAEFTVDYPSPSPPLPPVRATSSSRTRLTSAHISAIGSPCTHSCGYTAGSSPGASNQLR